MNSYSKTINVLTKWAVFILVLSSLLLSGCGSAKPKTYTIGVINTVPSLEGTLTGFKQGMTELGYIEGENVTYIYPGATSMDKLDEAAQALVNAKVDLIFCLTTPTAQAAKRATADNNIPVIFAVVTDPVGGGVVASLPAPGGNITGITFGPQESQRFAWMTKIAPNVKRLYIPYDPKNVSAKAALKIVTETAGGLGLEIITREVNTPEEVDAALANLPENIDAIYTLPDSLVATKLDDLLAVATAHHLATSVATIDEVEKGHLYGYAMQQGPTGVQAARLADQILKKGVKPADLPVETSEFFLSINLKTAQILGITIPDSILSQADKIYR